MLAMPGSTKQAGIGNPLKTPEGALGGRMGVIGAGVGAAAGGVSGLVDPGTDEQGQKRSRLASMLRGILSGGAVGGAAGLAGGAVAGGVIRHDANKMQPKPGLTPTPRPAPKPVLARSQGQPKQACDRRLRQLIVKKAAEHFRSGLRENFSRSLDKLAYDCSPPIQQGLRAVQIALAGGWNLGQAIELGFPKLAADRREAFAQALVKVACSKTCGAKGPQSSGPPSPKKPKGPVTRTDFHGKRPQAMEWMKANS
jgi:hypothetical protein